MSSTLQASVFMVKNFSDSWHSIKKYRRSHNETDVRHIWEIRYPNNQMIYVEWIQLIGKILYGNNCFWSVMKKSSISCTQRSTYSQILYCALEGWTRTHNQINCAWEDRLTWFKEFITMQNFGQNWRWANWIRVEYLPRIHHIAALPQSPRVTCLRLSVTARRKSQDGLSSCRCLTTSHGDLKTMNWNNKSNAQLVSLYAKRFGAGQWSFFRPGSEKKWYSISEDSPQGEWDKIAEKMMLTLAENTHPVFRSTSPLSRGVLESKGGGKFLIHYYADSGTIETVLRTIVSVNQLSLYGAVADMCEECESFHDSCQMWWIQTYFWLMILHKKKIYCEEKENDLTSFTTRQSEQILYWCRILDHSWSRTVFHDKRHWRIFTIHRFSGLSWVHLAKRRKFIWTERLDQREHQNWARIGSYNLLPTR